MRSRAATFPQRGPGPRWGVARLGFPPASRFLGLPDDAGFAGASAETGPLLGLKLDVVAVARHVHHLGPPHAAQRVHAIGRVDSLPFLVAAVSAGGAYGEGRWLPRWQLAHGIERIVLSL